MIEGNGKLMGFTLEEIVWMCSYLKKNGMLRLTSPAGTGHISMFDGNIVEVACPETPQLGELLIRHNMITTEQLIPILEEQSKSSKRLYLGELLMQKELVSEEVLLKLLELQSFIALKLFSRWQHVLYEFLHDVDDVNKAVSISFKGTFKGISPLEILQRITEASQP